jgi:hypothetical protein
VCLDFSRHDYMGPPLAHLLDIIAYVKPTALLGLSTTKVRISSCLTVYGASFLILFQGGIYCGSHRGYGCLES